MRNKDIGRAQIGCLQQLSQIFDHAFTGARDRRLIALSNATAIVAQNLREARHLRADILPDLGMVTQPGVKNYDRFPFSGLVSI